ncbi:MAG: ester cyclase [Myxococcota bacterium]|nr:ester cyclase [Myxococcota bacterium]
MADMLELIKQHLAAYSTANWATYRAAFAADVVYEEMATRQRVQGVTAYLDAVQRWKRAFPDLQATLLTAVVSGDEAAVEVAWEGTHMGPFDGPLGAIAPTHQRGRVTSLIVLRVADGKIVELRHYFDLLTVLGQLGVVPMMGPARPAGSSDAAASQSRH